MQESLKTKSVKGMVWVAIEKFATQLIRFGFSIVMARLLSPDDYGAMGMLAIFIAISSLFIDSGFGLALIQKKDRDDTDYSTVFYFNLLVALVAYGVLYFASPLIARFYRMPILCDVCRVTALGLPLGALCTIQRTKLTIELNFRAQTTVAVIALVISGTLGVYMAYSGYGVWALVWQGICGNLINILLLWTISKWRPQMVFSIESFKRFFSFGWKHVCTCLITTIYNNLYTLVIGRAFGAADIGYFTRAEGYAVLAENTVTETVMRVNFPVLAKYQDDRERLLHVYRKMIRTPMFVLVPLLFGMAITAKPLISVMIGEKWLPCVPYLQVLCIAMLFGPLSNVNLNLLYAKGRTDCVLKLDLMKKPIAFFLVISMIPFGVLWMCVSKAIYGFVAFVFNCHYTKKILGYGMKEQLLEIAPIVLESTVMALVVWFSLKFITGDFAKILVAVPLGGFIYIVVAALGKDESLMDIWHIVSDRLRVRRDTP